MDLGIQTHRSRFPFSLFNPRCSMLCTGQNSISETESDVSIDSLLRNGSWDYAETELSSISDGSCKSRDLPLFVVHPDTGLGDTQRETRTEDTHTHAINSRVRSLDELELEWYGKQIKLSDNIDTGNCSSSTSVEATLVQADTFPINSVDELPASRTSTIRTCVNEVNDINLEEIRERSTTYLDGNYLFNFERQCEFNLSISRTLAPWTRSTQVDHRESEHFNEQDDQVVPELHKYEHMEKLNQQINQDTECNSIVNQNTMHTLNERGRDHENYVEDQINIGVCDNEPSMPLQHQQFDTLSRYSREHVEHVMISNILSCVDSCETNEDIENSSEIIEIHHDQESSEHKNKASTTVLIPHHILSLSSNSNRTLSDVSSSPIPVAVTPNGNDSSLAGDQEEQHIASPASTSERDTREDLFESSSNLSTPSRVSLCSTLFNMDTTLSDGESVIMPITSSSAIPLFNRPALPASSHFTTSIQPRFQTDRRNHTRETDITEYRFEAIFAEVPPLLNTRLSGSNDRGSQQSDILSQSTSESRSSTLNSRTSSDSSGSDTTRGIQQQWYIYDPRLVNDARTQRIQMATRHRGQTNAWSMPGIVQPPSYDEVNNVSINQEMIDITPPPYKDQGDNEPSTLSPESCPTGPPPSYDQSLEHRLYQEGIIGNINCDSDTQSYGSEENISTSLPHTRMYLSSAISHSHPFSYPPPTYRLISDIERPSTSGCDMTTENETGEMGQPIDNQIYGRNDESFDIEFDEDLEDITANDHLQGRELCHTLSRYPVGSVIGQRPVLRWTGAVNGRRINTTQNWFL